jgi:hypothetical protein
MATRTEGYRLALIRQLEEEERRANQEAAALHLKEAQLQQKKQRIRDAMLRASAPPSGSGPLSGVLVSARSALAHEAEKVGTKD